MTILTKKVIKQLEDDFAAAGSEHIKLMENAGDALARFIFEKTGIDGKAIAVVCGHGNNGGDGYMAAKKLYENGARVCVLMVDGQPKTNDAIDIMGRCERAGVHILQPNSEDSRKDMERFIMEADIVVDALYGAGFHGEMPEQLRHIVELINLTDAMVISADIPSGVCADSGEISEWCVRAKYTVAFTAMKPGHLIYPGAEYCGTVMTAQIGISEEAVNAAEHTMMPIDYQSVRLCFPQRKADTNKGTYGTLVQICGSDGMAGAAVFSGKAAVQSGVGLVRSVLPRCIYPIVANHLIDPVYHPMEPNELGTLRAEDGDKLMELISVKGTAVLMGCGLGLNDDTKALVRRVITESEKPIVLDADGLNAIADDPYVLKSAKAPIIITPHPGEMARLSQTDAAHVQSKRLSIAGDFAEDFGVYVILKGANTLVSLPNGKTLINLSGNPGMAKGGSGDVLAGIISGLLAQGMRPEDACMCGVYIHGTAGDRAAQRFSQHSMTPTDIIFDLPSVFGEIER